MKTLTAYNITQTSNAITTPFYLVDMGFTDNVSANLRLSTRETYTYNSYSYSASRNVKVSGISSTSIGDQKGSLTFEDSDNYVSTFVLADGCAGKPVTIYQGYGDTPDNADMVHVFDGIMDMATIVDDKVTINILSNIGSLFSPGLLINGGLTRYLPRAGTVINTGNALITLNESTI